MLVPFAPAPAVYLSHPDQAALQKHVAQVADAALVASACLHHWGRSRVRFARGKMSHRTYGFVECSVSCYHHVTSLMVREFIPGTAPQLRAAIVSARNDGGVVVSIPNPGAPPAIGVTW